MNIEEITTYLSEKGFVYTMQKDSASYIISFSGTIETKKYDFVPIILHFDTRIDDFPIAQLRSEIQASFEPFHNPHIEKEFFICYKDNSVVFDKNQIEESMDFVFSQIKHVLDDYEKDDMTEILKEWKSYWYPADTYYTTCVKIPDALESRNKFLVETKNIDFPEIKVIKIPEVPSIKNCNWPIETVSSLFAWLQNDIQEKEIELYIKRNLKYKRKTSTIAIYSEKEEMMFAISFTFTSSAFNIKKHHLNNTSIDLVYKSKVAVKRYWIDIINNQILQQSNVNPNFLSLEDKKISLIGAGTIGSNLAQILIRLGAGSLQNKPFVIVDYDTFEPENFTRHVLPFESFGKSKAIELANYLRWLNPLLEITYEAKSVYNYDLDNTDFIIDTTGEDCVTNYLNTVHFDKKNNSVLIISWVHVDGLYVSSLIIPGKNCADYTTVYKNQFSNTSTDRISLPSRNSCSSIYVPFPIMLSQYAALLTTKCIRDYMNNKINKTTLYTQNTQTGEIQIKYFE